MVLIVEADRHWAGIGLDRSVPGLRLGFIAIHFMRDSAFDELLDGFHVYAETVRERWVRILEEVSND